MSISKTRETLERDCIGYAEAVLSEYTKAVDQYYSSLFPAIQNQAKSIEDCFPLYNKQLGRTASIAVFCSKGFFWLFFLRDGDAKVKELIEAFDEPKFSVEWLQNSLNGIPRQTVIARLNLTETAILHEILFPGGEPFALFPLDYLLYQAKNDGPKYAKQHAAKAEQLLQNGTAPSSGRASSVPPEIHDALDQFKKEHPDPTKVAFIMMSFSTNDVHQRIFETIQSVLSKSGITALRADHKHYHDDLYSNILTYVHGCNIGIGVFEAIETASNPNVFFEVGYMMGMGRQVCLLKDRTFNMATDLLGRLFTPFDSYFIERSLPPALSKWLDDRGLEFGKG